MHDTGAMATSVKLVITRDIKLIDLVHAASEKMALVAGCDADEALNFGLAVREAVINAIVHGNKGDRTLEVDVTLSTNSNGLKARVGDRGEGFDPQTTPDPTEGDNLLASSGRGLLMIRAFVDEVEIGPRRGRGTAITLTKKLD